MIKSRLREVLDTRGIKHGWLAQKVEINPGTLSMLVNGKRVPTLEVAFRIAEVLNLSVEEIWYRVEE